MSNTNGHHIKGAETLTIDCPACQQRFSKSLPQFTRDAHTTYTSLVATHEKMIICPKCGQAMKWVLQGVAFNWTFTAVSEDERRQTEGTSLILPKL